jgi:hypothetical protein
MRDNVKLIESMNIAVTERLDDKKNVIKGDFPSKLSEALEHDEILMEVLQYPPDFEKLRYECADAVVTLSFCIQILDNLINNS